MEQKRPPQRHVNPVKPTFFLQTKQRFFFFFPSLSPLSESWLEVAPISEDADDGTEDAIDSGTAEAEAAASALSMTGVTTGTVGWAVSRLLLVAEKSSLLFKLFRLELAVGPGEENVHKL